MDEYLFLVIAKLKADRKKLEREQRLHLDTAPAPQAEVSAPRAERIRKVFHSLEWGEQP